MTLAKAMRKAAETLDGFTENYHTDDIMLCQVGWVSGTASYAALFIDNQRRVVIELNISDDDVQCRHGVPLRPTGT